MARWREKAREHLALLIEQSTFLFEEQRPICSQCILLNLFCFISISFLFSFPSLLIVVYLVLVLHCFGKYIICAVRTHSCTVHCTVQCTQYSTVCPLYKVSKSSGSGLGSTNTEAISSVILKVLGKSPCVGF